MIPKQLRSGYRQFGFSLVEIMVAVLIGMLGILVIMQVFLVYEGQKRTTTGAGDAQASALIALFMLERDLRMSGLGVVGLGCPAINAYHQGMNPQNFNFAPRPVIVRQNTPNEGSDSVSVMYSNSSYGNIPTTLVSQMPNSSAVLDLKNGEGFSSGNLVLLSEGNNPCTLVQASQDGQRAGGVWKLVHNPGVGTPYNPPGGHNIFPAAGYGPGARVTNLGTMVRREYFVEDGQLWMRDLNLPDSATNPLPLVESIIAIRAQHGRDTTVPPDGTVDIYDTVAPGSDNEVVAVRLAVITRSGQMEREEVSPATLVLWPDGTVANGGAIALDADARRFRYKVHNTIVPLRNVIWN